MQRELSNLPSVADWLEQRKAMRVRYAPFGARVPDLSYPQSATCWCVTILLKRVAKQSPEMPD